MALPAAIQAQVEQADKILAAMNAPPPDSAAPGVTPDQEAQPAQASSVPQAEARPPEPVQQAAPVDDQWERKYKSLQGIFNKEVPSLQGQVKDLTARLEQAVAQLDAVRQTKPEEKPHKPEADPQDVETFGSDLVDMVQRVSLKALGQVAQRVDAEFSKLSQRLTDVEKRLAGTTQTVVMTAEEKFFERLAQAVPEWEAINTNDRFIGWLQEVDPIYGVPRKVALDNARDQLDVTRVINIFRAFAGPATSAPAAPSPVDKQVSPRAGAGNSAPAQVTKPVFTQKQIADFYNDVARRKYVGREKDAAALEAEINAAIAEGRVR